MADDDIDVRIRLRGSQVYAAEMREDARATDDLGDKAQRTARRLRQMGRASRTTRVQFGPFSTSLRFAALGVGLTSNALPGMISGLLGAAEAATTLVGGAAGAGGAGLVGVAQVGATASLALANVEDALSGNEAAYSRLTPAQAAFVEDLRTMQPLLDGLRETAAEGLFPGAGRGLQEARRNYGVVKGLVGDTAAVLGSAAEDAGRMLGSREFGRDLQTVGQTNVRVLSNLSDAGLNLANAARDVVTEGAPLLEWTSEMVLRGSSLLANWIAQKRETGELAGFYAEARDNLAALGRATGNVAGGVLNLFGADDVDGRRTLANFEQLTQRFEAWTNSPAVQHGVGDALRDQIPEAVGAVVSGLAENLPAAAAESGRIFWESFWNANVEGKAFIAAVTGAKIAGAIRGTTPLTPMFTKDVGGLGVRGPGGPTGGPGGGGRGGPLGALGRILRNPVVRRGAGTAGGIASVYEAAWWLSQHRNEDFRTVGPGARRQDPSGAAHSPSAQQRALRRMADPAVPGTRFNDPFRRHGNPFGPIQIRVMPQKVTLKVQNREIATAEARYRARERARSARRIGGPASA